jgi:mono/diheme cytochrome c family protein
LTRTTRALRVLHDGVYVFSPMNPGAACPRIAHMGKRDDALLAVLTALVIVVVVTVGIVAWAAGHSTRPTATFTVTSAAPSTSAPAEQFDPAVAAGAHDFVQFACAQCHGEQGKGGVSPDVPALTAVGKEETVAQLRHIIDHGLGESGNPTKPYMPVWGEVISRQQVSDLVAYLRAGLPAVPDAVPVAVPQGQGPAVAGAGLYVKFGCINCHGPNGLGGVPNPQSPDQTIPPLSGVDFRNEFDTPAKIKEMIRTGSVLGSAPIVSMPHWGGILTEPDYDALVAYIDTLKP